MFEENSLPDDTGTSPVAPHIVTFIFDSELSKAAVGTCIELLETANTLLDRQVYHFNVLDAQEDLRDLERFPKSQTLILFGQRAQRWRDQNNLTPLLRSWFPCLVRLGLVGGAAFLLLEIPSLRTREVTVHAEMEAAAKECGIIICPIQSPTWQDKQVYSAFSGLAALYMILDMIIEDLGWDTAQSISDYVGLALNDNYTTPVRDAYTIQARGCQTLLKALDLMRNNVETPMSPQTLCRHLAASERKLERNFKTVFGETPMTVYRNIRLDHAKGLLLQTDLPIVEICAASGFASKSNFVQWYRKRFNELPTKTRLLRYTGTMS